MYFSNGGSVRLQDEHRFPFPPWFPLCVATRQQRTKQQQQRCFTDHDVLLRGRRRKREEKERVENRENREKKTIGKKSQ